MPLLRRDGLERQEVTPRADFRNRPTGAVIGLVTNNTDPESMGRVKVRFPWLDDRLESHWARIAQPYSGSGRGSFWLPEVGDEVVVVFDRGDPSHPYVLGGVWNGEDAVPPPGNEDGANNHKIWRTRNSHQVIFNDTEGGEKITITDGKNERHLVIDVAADTITLTANPGDITFEAPAESILVECKDLKVDVQNKSTWKIGTVMSSHSGTQSESVGAADTLNVGARWNVAAPSTSVSATSSSVTVDKVAASVSGGLSFSTSGARKTKTTTVSRESGPEVSTMGILDVHADDVIALVANGPGTINLGAVTLKAPDLRISTTAVLTVMGGLIALKADQAITAKAGLVTVC